MEYGPSKTARYLAGKVDQYVKQAARNTIMENVRTDPTHPRYARVPDGGACDFCVMAGSRGFVYHSEDTAGSSQPYHPYCQCQVAVMFDRKAGTAVTVRGDAVPYDPDELYRLYAETGKSFDPPKSRVFKHFAESDFMADPLKYLREAQSVGELEARAAEVLERYKATFTDEQLAKYLPSARSVAQKRMAELKEIEKQL